MWMKAWDARAGVSQNEHKGRRRHTAKLNVPKMKYVLYAMFERPGGTAHANAKLKSQLEAVEAQVMCNKEYSTHKMVGTYQSRQRLPSHARAWGRSQPDRSTIPAGAR